MMDREETEEEVYNQDEPWERLLFPIHEGAALEEEDLEYDAAEFLQQAQKVDWNQDSKNLGLSTKEHFQELSKWLDDKKETTKINRDLCSQGGLPGSLNMKQRKAFSIVRRHLLECDEKGISNAPQLLLNIQGAPGTGK